MSKNLHKYEELTPFEFNREKERASIIYLASGPLEFHEECNALGVDAFKGYDWCLAAAEKTGGIVQGMSGTPIIQNGKLIGAITHVIVENPQKGYAVFAQTMLEASK